jgi:hypothetical protein
MWRVRVTIVYTNSSSLCIVDLRVAVGSVEVFIVAMEMQQGVLFAQLLSYKISRSAGTSIKVLRSSCELPRYFGTVLTKFGVPSQISVKVTNIRFHENTSRGTHVDTWWQMVRWTDMAKLIVSLLDSTRRRLNSPLGSIKSGCVRHSVFLWNAVTGVVRVYYDLQEVPRK